MHSTTLVVALVAALSTLAEAHGKIAVMTGDAGGNTTALGIQGGVIPGAGRNRVTEPDTTVFQSRDILSDGLGRTKGNGKNTVDDMAQVAALSGSTLPQVSADGGFVSGTYHIVTTDGAGPVRAVIDPSGTGQFSSGTEADVVTQVPGKGGNIAPGDGNGGFKLLRRAANVNTDHPLKIAVPAGTTCTGTMGGQSNVCLMKIANSNRAGPFGGVIAFQMAPASGNGGSASTGSATAGQSTSTTKSGSGNAGTSNTGSDTGNSNNQSAGGRSGNNDSLKSAKFGRKVKA